MSLDPLFPYAGNHAIQNLSCALEWSDRLNDHDFRALRARIEQRLQTFRHFQSHQALTVNVSEGSSPVVAAGSSVGFTCSTSPPIGEVPRRSISFMPEKVMIAINEYSGWSTVKKDIDVYVKEIVETVGGNNRGLATVGFQYTDVFHWKADPAALNLLELFNRDTLYLSPAIFQQKSYWHCTQGFFSGSNWPNSRQLINVNVQRAEAGVMDSLEIVSAHKLIYDKPQWVSASDKQKAIGEIYELFHQDNKDLLKNLLTPAVCEKIKLA